MKIRSNYVSNSSSASFVVYNWFDIPKEKREYIRNYDENALKVWEENNIPFLIDRENEPYFHEGDVWKIAQDKIEASENKLSEKEIDEIYEFYNKFAFGWLNNSCIYSFEEHKERNTCDIKTSMANFNMEVWLKYNNIDFDILER